MESFTGKVAVVTGAASGIGRALAGRCAQEGMHVVMADTNQNALDSAWATVQLQAQQNGREAVRACIDVSRLEQIQCLADITVEKFGGPHLLFNNAGVVANSGILHTTLDEWERVINVNLWGVIHGIRTFLPLMRKLDSAAHIVNTASVAGLIASGGSASYSVSKHGVVSLTESLYFELSESDDQIGTSVLCPGVVNTNLLDNLPQSTQQERQKLADMRAVVAAGMAPDLVAQITFSGIRAKQLYITTDNNFDELIKIRANNIITGQNPIPETQEKLK